MSLVSASVPSRAVLMALGLGSLVLMVHTFGIPLLPNAGHTLSVAEIQPDATPGSHAFVAAFSASAGDAPNDRRSHLEFFEDGTPLVGHAEMATVVNYGHGNYTHRDGRLFFSTSDNSDPRKNGRDYDLYYPVLYSPPLGYAAAFVFGLVVMLLGRSTAAASSPGPSPAAAKSVSRFGLHVAGASALLLLGLYCSTGTLSPYANNGNAFVATSYKFIYNPDHVHFRALFQFIDGQPRPVWEGAIFLRRILFPVLTYPFMKIWGFEIGGAIGSLVLNTAAFAVFLVLLRRFIGERGTIFAAWLLALYPGATYWGGLPYVYSIIFPACLLLTIGLLALRTTDSLARVAWISLAMGVSYLGYDLIVFYLPVSLFVLLVRRRFGAAVVAAGCQILPLAAWLFFLQHGLHQGLTNSNSAAFGVVLNSYRHLTTDLSGWWQIVQHSPAIALNVFFGANFLFLAALFLFVLLVNASTSRVRFTSVEVGLLGLAGALFLFNNLAPDYVAPWQMRGTWIARIYQPVFPALVLFCARWFAALPPLSTRIRWSLGGVLIAFSVGNALVVFGPILNNPLALSENVFFAFVDSMAPHSLYENNLRTLGRRPLGFRYEAP